MLSFLRVMLSILRNSPLRPSIGLDHFEPEKCIAYAVVIYGVGHYICLGFHLVAGISHGYADTDLKVERNRVSEGEVNRVSEVRLMMPPSARQKVK